MSVKSLALCLFPVFACAHELQEAGRGLAVNIEHLDGSTEVNGLKIELSRATGSAVPQLASRILARWREDSEPGSIRTLQCCGWQIASRIRDGHSQVVQWRSGPAGGELIFSSADLLSPAQSMAPPASVSIAGCRWTAPVGGHVDERQYTQLSARCDRPADDVIRLLGDQLSRAGWTWHRAGTALLQASKGSSQLQLIAAADGEPGERYRGNSTFVLIETSPAKGEAP